MMKGTEYYMVINLGLKSIRCIIFDDKGKTIEQDSLPIMTYIKDEWVEQNPSEWLEKMYKVIESTTYIEEVARNISAVSVTSSSSCLVCVDPEGTPLGHAIMVSDKRSQQEAIEIESHPLFDEIKNATGLGISAYLQLPKILWLKKNKPEIFSSTHKFLSPNDFLLHNMTGMFVTDIFNAQKYHFDYLKNKYPVKILDAFGIDLSTMPAVGHPGDRVGPVKENIKKKFGLGDSITAYLSTYDAICAFLGSGPTDTSIACDVSGTVTSVRAYSPKEITEDLENIFQTPLKSHNMYIIGGSNNIGGGLIEWLKQSFYSREENPYEVMEKEAQESTVGARGLIFLPYIMGERAPVWDQTARGIFFGIERTHSRKDFSRAVFESTAFITADLLNEITKTGLAIERIRVSGGLSQIRLINQIKADVLGMDVDVVENFETTSLGCLALMLVGRHKDKTLKQTIESIVRVRVIHKPKSEYHETYKRIFSLYKNLYATCKPLFKERLILCNELYTKTIGKIENL